MDEGGSSGSARNGAGSAAIVLGVDGAVLRQTDPEEHEPQVLIVKNCPTCLAPQEVEAHQASGHVQYRSWCKHCVSTRGIGHQHRSSVKDDDTIPTLSCDCVFICDTGDSGDS